MSKSKPRQIPTKEMTGVILLISLCYILLSAANSLLFWPMITMFVVGIFELIIFVVKRRKKALNKEDYEQKTVDITSTNNIEEIKKYKDFFDQGIITQEEFDAKKKQILGL